MNPKSDLSQIKTIADGEKNVATLFETIENQHEEITHLKQVVQELKDEINRLKGEQGRPEIKASKKNYSSEKERKKRAPKPKSKRIQQKKTPVDEQQTVSVNKSELPEDAQFKGYVCTTIQDIRVKRHNIEFRRERYYSPSQNQSYTANLPQGHQGKFGPQLKALILSLYHHSGLSEPKIREFLTQFEISISMGTISNIVSQVSEMWETEVSEIFQAGVASTRYHHLDDTPTRVNGVNYHCHVLCNPLYSYFATLESRKRLGVLQLLQNQEALHYKYTSEMVRWLEQVNVPTWARDVVAGWVEDDIMTENQVASRIEAQLAHRLNQAQIRRIYEAGALGFYRQQTVYPTVPILVTDDASQFRYITQHQLCWIHEARHYKKLNPALPYHQALLDQFLTDLWDYYHQLQDYSLNPSPDLVDPLRLKFQTLFSRKTSYPSLDKRIRSTLANQDRLLLVLDHPETPLHNNPAELAARRRVRKRDVSFGPRTDHGRRAWDIFMTLSETAKKLGVSFYHYILDRLSMSYHHNSLAQHIRDNTHLPSLAGASTASF